LNKDKRRFYLNMLFIITFLYKDTIHNRLHQPLLVLLLLPSPHVVLHDQPFEQVTWPDHQLLPLLAAVAWDISAFFSLASFS
jgi:hypothetical protein